MQIDDWGVTKVLAELFAKREAFVTNNLWTIPTEAGLLKLYEIGSGHWVVETEGPCAQLISKSVHLVIERIKSSEFYEAHEKWRLRLASLREGHIYRRRPATSVSDSLRFCRTDYFGLEYTEYDGHWRSVNFLWQFIGLTKDRASEIFFALLNDELEECPAGALKQVLVTKKYR